MGQETTAPRWRRQLAAAPRLVGEVPLCAYDCSLRRLVISQYLQFDGLLQHEALETGLCRALQQFPIFLGRIEPHLPHHGTGQLCWDSHDIDNLGIEWETAVKDGQPPNLWSTWSIWKNGLAPAVTGRLAAAKVTLFPAAKKSLMIFAFDHAVCDYPTAYNFMYLWFEEAAAAACLAAGSVASTDSFKISPVSSVDALISIGSETEGISAAKPALQLGSMASRSSSLGAGLGEAAGSLESFSRRWYEECCHWQLPPSPYTSTGGSSAKPQEQQQEQLQQDQLRAAAQKWLDRHSRANCPFPWDPLNSADACRQAWQLVWDGLGWGFTAWKIPRCLMEGWKVAAAAACPLPDGGWYSSNNAATAMLVATLYKASPAKARAQGGLHVAAVVDLRGSRCGMTIPRESATNTSVWGIRTWVPDHILAAADGQPTPELMHCLRVGLSKQLKDPRGSMNRQFEYWEAVRRAGRCHEVQLAQGLQQLDEDDICVDWLTTSASSLPSLPGTTVTAASVRWLPGYFKRMVMASPVPAASADAAPAVTAAAAAAGECSMAGGSSFDIQFELSLPDATLRQVAPLWQQAGLIPVTNPSREGGYWQPLDAFVYPYVMVHTLENMFLRLPAFIRQWCGDQVARLSIQQRKLLLALAAAVAAWV